ncbi:MAG: hypothetical protein GY788_24190 [bacterium]|nr:hypothetical protein [bacterium]
MPETADLADVINLRGSGEDKKNYHAKAQRRKDVKHPAPPFSMHPRKYLYHQLAQSTKDCSTGFAVERYEFIIDAAQSPGTAKVVTYSS